MAFYETLEESSFFGAAFKIGETGKVNGVRNSMTKKKRKAALMEGAGENTVSNDCFLSRFSFARFISVEYIRVLYCSSSSFVHARLSFSDLAGNSCLTHFSSGSEFAESCTPKSPDTPEGMSTLIHELEHPRRCALQE